MPILVACNPIGNDRPLRLAVDINAHGLARYTALCQDALLGRALYPL